MDSTSKSVEEQLAEALRENADSQRFFYAAMHDLRQPLRTISSYAQLLERQHAHNEHASELTAFIVGGVHEINTLIDDLLKYSQTGNSLRRTMASLNSVVQLAIINLQNAIRECGAEIAYAELPELPIDEPQFLQLFQQLFSNALKFRGRETPKVEVAAAEEADACMISVRDNGQGIEPRFHEQVFQPFKRLHGKEIPGTGLGLALCRKIVDAHGGKIWVESDGEHGSVFKFTVPL